MYSGRKNSVCEKDHTEALWRAIGSVTPQAVCKSLDVLRIDLTATFRTRVPQGGR